MPQGEQRAQHKSHATYQGNNRNRYIMVNDGQYFSITGTSVFVDPMLVKNCDTMPMSGTSHLHGFIFIGTARCPFNCDPFSGNSAPALRHSHDGLGGDRLGFGTAPLLPSEDGGCLYDHGCRPPFPRHGPHGYVNPTRIAIACRSSLKSTRSSAKTCRSG